MITLIDDKGHPLAVSTSLSDSKERCFEALKYFNDYMEEVGIGRIYLYAVDQDGNKWYETNR